MASQDQQDRGITGLFGGHKKADQEPVTGTGHHAAAGTTVPVPPAGVTAQEHGHGKLHKSGSSSSSSSSEDESGVKKELKSKKGGIKDKIKNILPGTHNKQQDEYATTTPTATTGTGTGTGTDEYATTTPTATTGTGTGEKVGIVDKIKNILPGTHKKQQDEYATTGTGTATG